MQNLTNLHLEPHDYQIYDVGEDQGETAVFAG